MSKIQNSDLIGNNSFAKFYIDELEAQELAKENNSDFWELVAILKGEKQPGQIGTTAEYETTTDPAEIAPHMAYLARKISAGRPTEKFIEFATRHGISGLKWVKWYSTGKTTKYTGDRYTLAYRHAGGKILTKQPNAKGTEFYSRTLDSTKGHPFGWQMLPEDGTGKICALVEGENDALAINWHLNTYGVYAITYGGTESNAKQAANHYKELIQRGFRYFILMDNDEPGRNAAKKIRKATKAPILNLGKLTQENDICDYLATGANPLELLSLFEEITLRAGERVSNYANNILDIIARKHDSGQTAFYLKADTDAGKTYAVIHHIAPFIVQRYGYTAVIVEPLNIKVEKDARQYGLPMYIGPALKKDPQGVNEAAMSSDIIITNHDMAPQLIRRLIAAGKEVALFGDECHTFITGHGYKPDKLTPLYMEAARLPFVFMYSATVKETYWRGFYALNIKRSKPKARKVYAIETEKTPHEIVLDHLKTADRGKVYMFKIQKKKAIKDIVKLLKKRGYKANEILTIYTDENFENSPEYRRIIEHPTESFSDSIRVILTTSKINEGLDIHSSREIEAISIEGAGDAPTVFDVDDLYQYANRHRTNTPGDLYVYYRPYHRKKNQPDTRREDFNKYVINHLEIKKLIDELGGTITGQIYPYSLENKYNRQTRDGEILIDLWAIGHDVERAHNKGRDILKALRSIPGFDVTELMPHCLEAFHETEEQTEQREQQAEEIAEILTEREELEKEATAQLVELFATDQAAYLDACAACEFIKIGNGNRAETAEGEYLYQTNKALFDEYHDTAQRIAKIYLRMKRAGIEAQNWLGYLITDTGRLIHHHTTGSHLSGAIIHDLLIKANDPEQLAKLGADEVLQAHRLDAMRTHIETDYGGPEGGTGEEIVKTIKNYFKGEIKDQAARQLFRYLFNVRSNNGNGRRYIITDRKTYSEYLDARGLQTIRSLKRNKRTPVTL